MDFYPLPPTTRIFHQSWFVLPHFELTIFHTLHLLHFLHLTTNTTIEVERSLITSELIIPLNRSATVSTVFRALFRIESVVLDTTLCWSDCCASLKIRSYSTVLKRAVDCACAFVTRLFTAYCIAISFTHIKVTLKNVVTCNTLVVSCCSAGTTLCNTVSLCTVRYSAIRCTTSLTCSQRLPCLFVRTRNMWLFN